MPDTRCRKNIYNPLKLYSKQLRGEESPVTRRLIKLISSGLNGLSEYMMNINKRNNWIPQEREREKNSSRNRVIKRVIKNADSLLYIICFWVHAEVNTT